MLILHYLFRYLARRQLRVLLTLSGISLSISAIVFAYGVSGWVESSSSRSLTQVLGASTIWVVPGGGVTLDPQSGLIIPRGSIPEETVTALSNTGIRLTKVVAAPVMFVGRHAVLYGDEREGERSGLEVSSDLWREFGGKPGNVLIGGISAWVRAERSSLPPRTILSPLAEARELSGVSDGASWLLSDDARPLRWAQTIRDLPAIKVTNSPSLEESSVGLRATVYLIEGSLSRFDPFSFSTKFSALTINSSMTTLFGVVARLVFIFGMALAITSTMISLRERRDEIAIFAVTGFESSVILLFLAEAVLTQVVCFLLGGGVGLLLLHLVLQGELGLNITGQSLGFGVVYLPVLVVLTTIIPSQAVASRRIVELIRRGS